jgi:hypothetical protein
MSVMKKQKSEILKYAIIFKLQYDVNYENLKVSHTPFHSKLYLSLKYRFTLLAFHL